MNTGLWRSLIIFVIVLAVLLALAIWVGITQGALARDISLILLVIPATLVPLLVMAVLIGGMNYGLYKLYVVLPDVFAKARDIMARIHIYAEKSSQVIVAPIIGVYALAARIRGWTRYITKEVKS